MAKAAFLGDVKTLRARARQHIEEGAGIDGDHAETAIRLLNDALATETVCALRYRIHCFVAKGIHAEPAADEFLEYANDEQAQADRIAQRIVQLGGDPDLSPDDLVSRSHTEHVTTKDLRAMIREDLVAERIALDSYREIAAYFAPFDSTSREMMEEIMAEEEAHAADLAELLHGRLPKVLTH